MHLADISLILMLCSLGGMFVLIAVVSYIRGADIDKRQKEMDEALRKQKERSKK